MIQQYYFTEGQFLKRTVYDFSACPDNCDWFKWLESQGWGRIGGMPRHQNHEFADVQAELFVASAKLGDLAGMFYVQISVLEGAWINIFCNSEIELLQLLRDWIQPLIHRADTDIFLDFILNASEYLFDEEFGLECAREVQERNRRRERYYRGRRKTTPEDPDEAS